MESVTHALIGTGIAALSGQPISLANPIYLGSILGSIAPDLDIIMCLGGHLPYLKHHRGFSHSLPGLTLISLAITGGLMLFYPAENWAQLFFWTLLGALSHSFMDMLNSYGAQVLWPFTGKKISLNLLMILDPFIIFLFGSIWFLSGDPRLHAEIIWGIFGFYLSLRMFMREKLKTYLCRFFDLGTWQNSFILPAIYGLANWDFAVVKDSCFIVGQVNFFKGQVMVRERLPILEENKIIKQALKSKLGQIFQDFTPYFHVTHTQDEDRHVVNFLDLRYYIKNDFLHHGTVILDSQFNLVEGIFHPYSKERNIRVL